MANPFEGLRPALEVIAQEAKVLPATGQALEELMRPDHEEVIDRLRSGDEILEVVIEKPNRQPYVLLKSLHRLERHPLRYFLDGSARTFFLGDAVEGTRRTPINVAQVGAAVVMREDNGQVHVAASRHRIYLMMDKKAVSFGDRVEEIIKKAGPRFGFHDLMQEDGETERTSPGKEPRSRAAHKAHHLMAQIEDELGRKELKREKDHWLVLDGSLSKDLYAWDEVPSFLGLAKSFSRTPEFKMPGARGGKAVNLYELLADLPFSSRTAAFSARSGKVVVWYVRLREQKHLDFPLMGVVKVELPNPGQQAVPSDVVERDLFCSDRRTASDATRA